MPAKRFIHWCTFCLTVDPVICSSSENTRLAPWLGIAAPTEIRTSAPQLLERRTALGIRLNGRLSLALRSSEWPKTFLAFVEPFVAHGEQSMGTSLGNKMDGN